MLEAHDQFWTPYETVPHRMICNDLELLAGDHLEELVASSLDASFKRWSNVAFRSIRSIGSQ